MIGKDELLSLLISKKKDAISNKFIIKSFSKKHIKHEYFLNKM